MMQMLGGGSLWEVMKNLEVDREGDAMGYDGNGLGRVERTEILFRLQRSGKRYRRSGQVRMLDGSGHLLLQS